MSQNVYLQGIAGAERGLDGVDIRIGRGHDLRLDLDLVVIMGVLATVIMDLRNFDDVHMVYLRATRCLDGRLWIWIMSYVARVCKSGRAQITGLTLYFVCLSVSNVFVV